MSTTRIWVAITGVLLSVSLVGIPACRPGEFMDPDEDVLESVQREYLFHNSEEIESRRIVMFEEALRAQGIELSEFEQEQSKAGQALLGLVRANVPIRHPNGTLEVPANARESVQAYVDSHGETGEARQLREFEGKVLYGFYDPLNPSLVEMKHRYLAAQGLPTNQARTVTFFWGDGGAPPDAGTDGGAPPDAGTDGGSPPDAGTDGGTDGGSPPDAGTDGGSPPDAGTDGGSPDAGSPPDSGVPDGGRICNVTCGLEIMMVTNNPGTPSTSASPSTACSYGRIAQASQGSSTAECSSVSNMAYAGSASASWSGCDKQGAGKVGCEFSGNGCEGVAVMAAGSDHGTLRLNSVCDSTTDWIFWPTGTGQGEGSGEVRIAEWGTHSDTYSRRSGAACGESPWSCEGTAPNISCDVTLSVSASSTQWLPAPGAEAGCELSTGFACTMGSTTTHASTSANAAVRSSARAVTISAPMGGTGYAATEIGSLGVALDHSGKGTKSSGIALGKGKGTYYVTASKNLGSLSNGSVPAGVTVNLTMGAGSASLTCGSSP